MPGLDLLLCAEEYNFAFVAKKNNFAFMGSRKI